MHRHPVLAASALLLASSFVRAGEPRKIDLFRAGEGGYQSYRIPAIVSSPRGTLLAFCEGRRNGAEDWGDIDVVLRRSRDGGRTWLPANPIVDFGSDTVGNPAPVVDRRTGTIWLLLTRNPGHVREAQIAAGQSGSTRTVWITSSRDDGLSWSAPEDITAAVKPPAWTWYATGPVNGIQLGSGRLVIPCDHDAGVPSQHFSHVIYSDDHGRNWKLGGSAGPNCNESTVAELPDGSLMLNMRSYAGRNRRAVSISRDGGLTFSEPKLDEALVEPVCQASLIAARDGRLLFANPADTKRRRLAVRLSRDCGASWGPPRVVHAGPAAYSNLIELKRGAIGLLYENGDATPYERISFIRLPPAWLSAR